MPRPKVFMVGLSAADRDELGQAGQYRGPSGADDHAGAGAAGAGRERRPGGRSGGDRGPGRVSETTVRAVAKRFVETGGDVQATIGRKQRETPPVPSVITGEVEARLIALACSAPPAGYAPLVAAAAGEARRADRGSARPGPLHHRPGVKKTKLRPHLKKCWTIPPHGNAEFAARMEDVLAVYARPYDPSPAGGVHGREALPAARPRPRPDPRRARPRPEGGQRVRPPRHLLDLRLGRAPARLAPRRRPTPPHQDRLGPPGRSACSPIDYPDAETVVLVMDNLNTHGIGSLYEAFDPASRRSRWPNGWRSTTPPNTAPGSTSPRSNCPP